jgi:molybdate-binding protein
LDLTAAGTVKTAAKNVGMYYKPVMNKDFDFVINAQIFEPVIQIAYEVKLRLIRAPKKVEKTTLKKPKTITKTIVKKKVLLITADGKVRDINLGS